MTWLDVFIQKWRIRVAARFIPGGSRVLDIGSADGALFRELKHLRNGVGIDPDIVADPLPNATLIRGMFPADLPDREPFDVITMLAVLEHIQPKEQAVIARACFEYLRPGGRVVITVPSPQVDYIVNCFRFLRLADGMALAQHYGYEVKNTFDLFGREGFRTVKAMKFQGGLNNLFVFEK